MGFPRIAYRRRQTMALPVADKPVVAFVWANFGPYHVDRLEAAEKALKSLNQVVGIEMAGSSRDYPWSRTETSKAVRRITIFPNAHSESISQLRQLWALIRICFCIRPADVFLCHYERLDTFLAAWVLRLTGRRVHLMIEAKFDDHPRWFMLEILKRFFLMPYSSALVGGYRTREYVEFLGMRDKPIEFGYDTVSGQRIRDLAGAPPAPGGAPFKDRHFTIVARLVPKKNIAMAIEAYARYRANVGAAARGLHICGSGELDGQLRGKVEELQVEGIVFQGFVQSKVVAQTLASTLALILPSVEEQWGLVVNEAVIMGVPILCSTNVGASDLLVRSAINGYTFEPHNPEHLAQLMELVASDEATWRRLAGASAEISTRADTEQFGAGVRAILHGPQAAAC